MVTWRPPLACVGSPAASWPLLGGTRGPLSPFILSSMVVSVSDDRQPCYGVTRNEDWWGST
jgi:hypothetical protein